MKNLIFVLSACLFLLSSCKEDLPASVPDCVQDIIMDLKKDNNREPKAEVIQFMIDNEDLYLVPGACCDQYSLIYDSNCNLICAPSGGFTGAGDGTCPSYIYNLDYSGGTVIWEDN